MSGRQNMMPAYLLASIKALSVCLDYFSISACQYLLFQELFAILFLSFIFTDCFVRSSVSQFYSIDTKSPSSI